MTTTTATRFALLATTRFRRASASLFTHTALERSSRLSVIVRSGVGFDNRFAPAARVVGRDRVMLYVVLAGSIHPSTELAPTIGESCWAFSEDDIEGAEGKRRTTSRTVGDPFTSVTLRLRDPVLGFARAPNAAPMRLANDRGVLDATHRYVACVRGKPDHAQWSAAANAFHDAVVAAGWLRQPLAGSIAHASPTLADRVWQGVSTFYGALELSPTFVRLAELAELSTRHTDRAFRHFVDEYDLLGVGWRTLTRHWRLKAAVLFLSCPDLTVSEVARLVGYSNIQALTNALAAEGLPQPSKYRELFEELARPRA
jgi:AraC-like DNA-binding protein